MKKGSMISLISCICLSLTGCQEGQNVVSKREQQSVVDQVLAEKTQEHSLKDDIDIDLTRMDRDMVYATAFHMMKDPDSFVGKTIRMAGLYDAVYYEQTGEYYHCCMIQDAAACCSQGMEFIWGMEVLRSWRNILERMQRLK